MSIDLGGHKIHNSGAYTTIPGGSTGTTNPQVHIGSLRTRVTVEYTVGTQYLSGALNGLYLRLSNSPDRLSTSPEFFFEADAQGQVAIELEGYLQHLFWQVRPADQSDWSAVNYWRVLGKAIPRVFGTVSWAPIPSASSYRVVASENSALGSWPIVGRSWEVEPPKSTQIVAIDEGTQIFAMVWAFDSDGKPLPRTAHGSIRTDDGLIFGPAKVKSQSNVQPHQERFALEWPPAVGAAYYSVSVAEKGATHALPDANNVAPHEQGLIWYRSGVTQTKELTPRLPLATEFDVEVTAFAANGDEIRTIQWSPKTRTPVTGSGGRPRPVTGSHVLATVAKKIKSQSTLVAERVQELISG